MKWIKQWVTGTAFKNTEERLTFIFGYIEEKGYGKSMEKQLKRELVNMEKLICGSPKRQEKFELYQAKSKSEKERIKKEKDSK